MYSNIGAKIKVLAQIFAGIGTGVSLLLGLICLRMGQEMVYLGLPVLILGPLLAWISSWILYGFGELIVKTTEIAANTSRDGSGFKNNDESNSNSQFKTLISLRNAGLISEDEYRSKIASLYDEEKNQL